MSFFFFFFFLKKREEKEMICVETPFVLFVFFHCVCAVQGNAQGLNKKDVEALTSKTLWTKEDLQDLHADFLKCDADKSGELDFKEFVGLLKSRIPMDEAGYKNLFSHMDSDNSGTVSFAELATSLSVVGKGSSDDKLAFTFDLYDTDKSGYLDRKECEHVLQQMKRVAATLGRQADDFIVGSKKKEKKKERLFFLKEMKQQERSTSWTRIRTERLLVLNGWRWDPRHLRCLSCLEFARFE